MSDPIIKRGNTRTVIGTEVDTLGVDLLCNAETLVGNTPLAAFAINGGFDGARLTVERSFAASWQSEACGSVHLFSGRVADVEVAGSAVHLDVNSDLELLNVMMPRNLYQATCIHTLYGPGCGLVAADFTVSAAVGANSTRTQINASALAQASGYFDLGTMVFTSGGLLGLRRTVKRYTTGVVVPVPPLPQTPSVGDTFDIRPGCDKLKGTCSTKFDNLANHRSFPYIPNPETAY